MPLDGAAAQGASDGAGAGRARHRDRGGSIRPAGSSSRDLASAPTWEAVERERAHSRVVRRRLPRGGRRDRARARLRPSRERARARRRRVRPRRGRSKRRAHFLRGRRLATIWPRPDERGGGTRRRRSTWRCRPTSRRLWVARAEALPGDWDVTDGRRSSGRPAAARGNAGGRGVWVHGCADGLGDDEPPDIDALAGRPVRVAAADAHRIGRSGRARDLRRRARRCRTICRHARISSGRAAARFARALGASPGDSRRPGTRAGRAAPRARFVRRWARRAASASGWTTTNGITHVTS